MYHVSKRILFYVWVDQEFDLTFDPSDEDGLTIDQWIEYDRAFEASSPDFGSVNGYVDDEMRDVQETIVTEDYRT